MSAFGRLETIGFKLSPPGQSFALIKADNGIKYKDVESSAG
jgi:hypothetical protein